MPCANDRCHPRRAAPAGSGPPECSASAARRCARACRAACRTFISLCIGTSSAPLRRLLLQHLGRRLAQVQLPVRQHHLLVRRERVPAQLTTAAQHTDTHCCTRHVSSISSARRRLRPLSDATLYASSPGSTTCSFLHTECSTSWICRTSAWHIETASPPHPQSAPRRGWSGSGCEAAR